MGDKPPWNLVHREALLEQLADALQVHERSQAKLCHLKVSLLRGDTLLVEIFSLQVALDYLVNDLYFDAEDNWQYADTLTVETY